ncbi:MAG: hypothetical protein MRZ63_07665 [Anaerostipes sp.]|uniref:hypothetical protein n=1 Tax=Anaerostipes sp. 992a TaxID=1261637 RepID=UPI0009513C00|nr:hypothetical protein [Anaerostipes sp. 992a]MCI5952176.1 hypothetical protein [Anaerostipes sp.]MDD5968519.1 hypothetical protein [Anaerostipes sp.]OLR63858.1 hypothetical protein BHF69_03260 [Anaerostipes sp. 992a]
MKRIGYLLTGYMLGILCCLLFYYGFFIQKKSNDLILQKGEKQIILDFSDSAKGTKIQFFEHYYIESKPDAIIIHLD